MSADPGQSAREALGLVPIGNVEASLAAGRYDEALASAEEMVRASPRDANAWNALGVSLRASGRAASAIGAYTRSLELKPGQPGTFTNLGNAYRDLLRFDEAVASQRAAVERAPESASYWSNLGVALRDGARYEEAVAAYDRAIELAPDNARTRVDRGQVLLMLGRYAEGWVDFDWRWKMADFQPPQLDTPLWDGVPQPDKTLMLWPEQGFGDTILSARYIDQARARVGRIILVCKPELTRLFSGLSGVDALVPEGKVQPHDLHAPLMSLARIFSPSTDEIPAPARLTPSDELPEIVTRRLDTARDFLKVGIVWSGSTTFKGNALRATSVEPFLDLASIPGVRLFSLQKGPRAAELPSSGVAPLIDDLGPYLNDFADTAAVIRHLDLVVMTDSSVAHLAGSLGVPVWNLLPRMPYWLYGPEAETTPWYPSMRLFRQPSHADWDSVFREVKTALRQLVKPAV